MENTARPIRWSISAGIPTPTASTSPPADSRASSTASTTTSSSDDWSRPITLRWARRYTDRSVSTAPASSFVPPMSTPMVRRPGMPSLYADAERPGSTAVQALPRGSARPQSAAARRGGARPRRTWPGRRSPRLRVPRMARPVHRKARDPVRARPDRVLAAALAGPVPDQLRHAGQQPARVGQRRAELRVEHGHRNRHRAHARYRPASQHRSGLQGAGRQPQRRRVESGHDHAVAGRRRHLAPAVDPA